MSYKVMPKRKVMCLRSRKRIMMARKAIERYNYDSKYRFLRNQISSFFAELLKANLEYLISGQITKINLASKWCTSLDSSYDGSTLICESDVGRLFRYDSCPEYKGVDEILFENYIIYIKFCVNFFFFFFFEKCITDVMTYHLESNLICKKI
jgi:hypothetical protein